jgi:exopolysaccharide production protein ExoQ
MSPEIAAVVYGIGILALFLLDRDRDLRTSKALWIPVVWLFIIGSRPVSQWLNIAPATTSPDQYLDGSPLDRVVFAILLTIGLIVLFTRGRRVTTLLRSNWPILLFFAYCALSTAWSDYPDVAFKRWIKGLGDLVMALIVLTDANASAAIRRLLARVGFVLLPASLLLIKYFPDLGREYHSGDQVTTAWMPIYTGVTTGKNLLGMITLTLGLGNVWRLVELVRSRDTAGRRRHIIAQGALLAIVLWLFWLANSVTSISCFAVGTCLLCVTGLWGRKPSVMHFFVAAALILSLFALFLDPGGGFIEFMGRDPTLTGRTAIWNVVLAIPANRWVGTGFESFWLGERLQQMWRIYWWHPNEAHNGYIEVFLNLGGIGLTLLALMLVTGYRRIISVFRLDPSISSLRVAYFVVALIYGFTEAAFRELQPLWIFLLLAVAVVPQACLEEGLDVSVPVDPIPYWADTSRVRTDVYEEIV